MTLVDSRPVAPLMHAGRWREVYALIPKCTPFPGVRDALIALTATGLKTAVVTSAPRPYAKRVLGYWQLPVHVLVAYHDTARHKPDPEPVLLALDRLRAAPPTAIGVGDSPEDLLAYSRAGCLPVLAGWAPPQTASRSTPLASHVCSEPRQLLELAVRAPLQR